MVCCCHETEDHPIETGRQKPHGRGARLSHGPYADRADDLQYGEGDILSTVERLKELDLLNDEAYAREFVRSRLATKPVSRQKLYMDLKAHLVPEEYIKTVLDELPRETEADNAREVAEKFWRQLSGLEKSVRRERVLRRLMSRGFSTEASLAAIRDVEEEES